MFYMCKMIQNFDHNYISWLYFSFESKKGTRGVKIMIYNVLITAVCKLGGG